MTEHLPPAYDRLCMHEFVLSGAPMKRELGLRTLDLAKRLLDHGFHPPTVYFPLLVDEALLIEPTETETQGDAGRVRRGAGEHPARGRRGSGDRAQRARKLRELGVTDLLPPAYDRLCMHEFVLSGAPMKKELGLRTLDLAKRLLDHNFHPPTVYFPLLVDEALLIEPTETETQGDARRVRRGHGRHPARRRGGSGDRPQRAVRDAGPPARRGRRGQAPGHPSTAVDEKASTSVDASNTP